MVTDQRLIAEVRRTKPVHLDQGTLLQPDGSRVPVCAVLVVMGARAFMHIGWLALERN